MTAASSISVAPWLAPPSPTDRHGSWRNLGILSATCLEMGASRGGALMGLQAPATPHSPSPPRSKCPADTEKPLITGGEPAARSLQDSAHEVFNQTTICPAAAFASVGTTALARPPASPPSCPSLVSQSPKGSVQVSISIHMQMHPRNGIYSVGLLHRFSANRLCSQEPAAT
jgi:hypothetical protein